MKYLIIYIFFLFGSFNSNAQNFFTIEKNTREYLEKLHLTMPDSIFYREGGEFNQFKEWENYWKQRLPPDGNFEVYYNSLKLGHDLLNQRSFTTYNTDWQEIGPTDEPAGTMSANSGQSAGIGPVEFVRFYKINPQNMLCGSTKGGLFFSKDGGDNWVNSGSDQWSGVSTVTWAEFKVDDPEVIYASSGEPKDNIAGPIQQTGGIYRSQKNGIINPTTTWDLIADYTDFGNKPDCRINKLLTDPYNPNVLYAATTWGLFKSSNVNTTNPTWINILPDNVWDVALHPGVGNNLIIYASFNSENNPNEPNPNISINSNIVKFSMNGGLTWSPLPNSPSSLSINSSSSNIRHISIRVSEASGLQQNVYLYYYGATSTSKNIYRYNFISHAYNKINQCGIDDLSCGGGNCCFGQGSAFGISQSGNDEIIFVAFADRYMRIVNGIETIFDFGNPNHFDFHVDIEGFTLNPTNANEVWMASHGGTYKSIDQGNSWVPKMKGVGVAMAYFMANSYESPEDILIGTYHDGCILTQGPYTNNWNPTWKYIYGADGSQVLIDNKDPNYMYASGIGSNWGRSSNAGISFTSIGFYTGNGWGEHFAVINKENSNIIYGRLNGEIIRSIDRGTTQGTIISNFPAITGISPCSQFDLNNIFTFEGNKDLLIVSFYNCVTLEYDLYYTLKATDPAINPITDWHKIYLGNGSRFIYDVDLDPLNPKNIYVVLYPDWSIGWAKVINKVENFTSFTPNLIPYTGNLPPTGLQRDCLVLEKGTNGGMYIATDLGAVFYTNNKLILAGLNNAWVKFGDDYPHVTNNGLEINYKINKIRAAPYSRGTWQTDLYCSPDLSFTETGIYTNDDYLEAKNWITSNAVVNSGVSITYRAGDDIILSSGFIAKSGSNFLAFIHPCDKPGNSFK